MNELKPCPFCGGKSETHRRKTSCRFYADSKNAIPKNGVLESMIQYEDGHKTFVYRKKEWCARCVDTSCIGRVCKVYPSEKEAIEAWNRRVTDGTERKAD